MEQECNKECTVEKPSQLWTVEYSYYSCNGMALVRADTADEAKMLFLNGSNFNGDAANISVKQIARLNEETLKGIVFEYYSNTVSVTKYS